NVVQQLNSTRPIKRPVKPTVSVTPFLRRGQKGVRMLQRTPYLHRGEPQSAEEEQRSHFCSNSRLRSPLHSNPSTAGNM
ncbi:hypothetical protein GN956_G26590, partial [Arapaima gigas]